MQSEWSGIAKEPREINKILKSKALKPLLTGINAISKSRIHPDLAMTIANIQEATGFAMIFQMKVHQIDNLSHAEYISNAVKNWKIFAHAQTNLPEFAFQEYEIDSNQKSVQQKYNLIMASQRLLRFLQEEISLKNNKYHTSYEKALLMLEVKHIYSNYPIFNSKNITPYEFLRKTIASYLCRTDSNFQMPFESLLNPLNKYDYNIEGSWLLISKGRNGEPLFIYGESQKQLIMYLIYSDYLEHFQINVPPNANMSAGWNKIIEKQLCLSHPVSSDTLFRFKKFEEITKLYEKHIRYSNIVRSKKIINLKAQKSKLESLSMIVSSSAANSLYEKIFVINKEYKREINKISHKIAEIERDSANLLLETQEVESEINQKIAELINSYPKHLQPISNDFLYHYFSAIEENILNSSEFGGSLTPLQMNNISILVDAAKSLRPDIPERVLQAYLQQIDAQMQPEDLAEIYVKLSQAQEYLNSDVLAQWIVDKYLILNPPYEVDEIKQVNNYHEAATPEESSPIEKSLFSKIIIKKMVAVKNSLKTIVFK